METIDGRKIRDEILEKLSPPDGKFLAAVIAGSDAASLKFLEEKKKIAEKLGVVFNLYSFPSGIQEEELAFELKKIAGDPACGGIIIQLPLPSQISPKILEAIPAARDPDALGPVPLALPPSVETVKEILKRENFDLKSAEVAVLGRGILVGKPVSKWLEGEAKRMVVIDKNDGLEPVSGADLVVSGAGRAGLFGAKLLKPGAGVIDFGTSFVNGKVRGDFDPEGAEKLSFYTPTPGGTGPILIAELFKNFCELNSGPRKKPD